MQKIIDTVQYGRAVLEDNSERALALIPKRIFNTTNKDFFERKIFTQWFKHSDKIFLSIYWLKEKKGLVFPFSKEQKDLIRLIIDKKSLAIGNAVRNKKLLVLTVCKNEPLDWIKNW